MSPPQASIGPAATRRVTSAAAAAARTRRIARTPEGFRPLVGRSCRRDSAGTLPVPSLRPYHLADVVRARCSSHVSPTETVVLEGRGRLLPASSDGPVRVTFGEADVRIEAGSNARVFAYR